MFRTIVKNAFAFAILVLIAWGSSKSFSLASQATLKFDESSPRQITLDKFIYAQKVSVEELKPILVCAPREAEVWCNRHHIGGQALRQTAIDLIILKLHEATVQLDQPLFPITF